MWIGQYQLGDLVPVSVWCRDSAKTPAEPDAVPLAQIIDGAGLTIEGKLIPILDRRHVTGFFQYRFNLDADFATGWYTVVVYYKIGGTSYAAHQRFEILPGGDNEGNGIAMHFFKQAAADFVLLQTDKGTLKRLRNPSVRGI